MNRETHSTALGYIMWIFGFIGIHRFYFGKPLTGILWFFTAGLLLVGWIVDLFLIPGMNQQASGRFAVGPSDYSVAWLLLIFLGPLGIHRLYLGKVWTGLLWMFTGGLLGLGVLYDLCTLNAQVSEKNLAKPRY